MKHFIAISASNINVNGKRYFVVNRSRDNKEYIIQYDTTFEQILHYCFGYIDCYRDNFGTDKLSDEIYFIAGNGIESYLTSDQFLNLISPEKFLQMQDEANKAEDKENYGEGL